MKKAKKILGGVLILALVLGITSHYVADEVFEPVLVTQDNVDELLARYAELGYTGE